MCDWSFHGLAEFDAWMPEREWVKAVVDLIQHGFAFDREGSKLRLRRRRVGEHAQSVVELLSGITLPDRIEASHQEAYDDEVEEEGDLHLEEDDAPKVEEGEGLALDAGGKLVVSVADYVTDTCSILARKGMGKTYLAMLVAELFLVSDFDVPFVVLDPTGCWYGLAALADGQPAPHRIVIFGGEHGHRGLSPSSGRVVARLMVALRIPTVLDLSKFSGEEQHRFVADFASELYLHNREAMHVFVDEADIFAPQRLDGSSKHHKRCLGALDNLVRRGRFRGVGNTLISQRPAVVSKNLLSQVGTMFFLNMVAPQDLDAVESWLHDNIRGEVKRDCRANLPVLSKGVAYYLKSGDKSAFKRFKVKQKTTFDSSYTPRLGETPVIPVLASLSAEDGTSIDEFLANEVVHPEVLEGSEVDKSEGEGDDDETKS